MQPSTFTIYIFFTSDSFGCAFFAHKYLILEVEILFKVINLFLFFLRQRVKEQIEKDKRDRAAKVN